VPLTLDNDPGSATANAYADVAAADLAAQYRVGVVGTNWLALTSDQKIQALVTGAQDIDSLGETREDGYLIDFEGDKTSEDQALEFPRDGETEVPVNIVKSNIELAFSYSSAFEVGATVDVLSPDPTAARVKRKKIDVLETEYFEPGASGTALERLPGIVQRWLQPFLTYTLIAGQWGSATVTRGS